MRALFIDPHCHTGSPSMKGIIRAIPHLQERGWEVELWCFDSEPGLEGVTVRTLPAFGPRFLRLLLFGLLANLFGIWQFLLLGKKRPDAIHTTGFYFLGADFSLCHFSCTDWFKKQLMLGLRSPKDIARLVLTGVDVVVDLIQMWNPLCRRSLAVSESVAGDFRRLGPPWNEVGVFPNSYQPERFGLAVREEWREKMREELGLAPGEQVFAFASTGHYRRKGFWLAAEGLSELRNRGNHAPRLLVIGGEESTLDALHAELAEQIPDFADWMIFTGMVKGVERYFAASDGFLFPSYSEAFSLVEIEASAMGLPLYLTPHHGSEMILVDRQNGRRIPFDPKGIADVLGEELDAGRVVPGTPDAGRAVTQEGYVDALDALLHETARRRGGDRGREIPATGPRAGETS